MKLESNKKGYELYELEPSYHQRYLSFYGKAHVIINNDDNTRTLQSYDTKVLKYDPKDHTIIKLWDDWSATTSNHIQAFLSQFGYRYGGKKEWDKWECNKPYAI